MAHITAVVTNYFRDGFRGHPLITSRRGGGGGYTDLVTVSDGKIWGGGGGVFMKIRDVTSYIFFLQHFRCSCTAYYIPDAYKYSLVFLT